MISIFLEKSWSEERVILNDHGSLSDSITLPISGKWFLVLIDFSLNVKAATLIIIYGRGSAISSANEGKSGFIYNLAKS